MYSFVPSPIVFDFDIIFKAETNDSGRMQYYLIRKGEKKRRISRTEFVRAFNNQQIIAIKPEQSKTEDQAIQMEIYVKTKK